MGEVFRWLSQYGILGVAVGMAIMWPIAGAALVVLGKLYTAGQVARDRERDKETIARQEAALTKQDAVLSNLSASLKELLQLGHATNHFVKEAIGKRRGG
jgi:hypothetical protein